MFVDKDGTLVRNVPFNVDPQRVAFTDGAFRGLSRLARAGFSIVIFTSRLSQKWLNASGNVLWEQRDYIARLLEAEHQFWTEVLQLRQTTPARHSAANKPVGRFGI